MPTANELNTAFQTNHGRSIPLEHLSADELVKVKALAEAEESSTFITDFIEVIDQAISEN